MIYFISKHINKDVISNKDIAITGLEKVKEDLKDEKEIVLDCETNGLSAIYNHVLVLQFGTPLNQYVIDARDYDISEFKDILEDESKLFIGHNIKFDYNMLKQYGIILKKVYDTMIADMVIHNDAYSPAFIKKERRFSLSGVHKHYFGTWIYKKIRSEIEHIGVNPLTHDMVRYAAMDTYYPRIIKEKQAILIEGRKLKECVDKENEVLLALGDIEYNGFRIDTQKWLEVVKKYQSRAVETEKQLDELLLQQPNTLQYKSIATQLTLFGEPVNDKKTIVNWRSDQQVLSILQNIFNIFPVDKDGKPSSGADAIQFLPDKTDFTELLLKYREETKVTDSFGEGYIKDNVDRDDRIRTSYNQVISTGRVSSRNPNLQQIKRHDPKDEDSRYFRESFCVPEGYMLSTADYSQQEARIMADFSNDESYIKFFNEDGNDAHSFVGTKLFSAKFKKEFKVSKTEHPEYRYQAKTLNFSISYGASAFTLAKRLKIDEKEAQNLIDSFYEGFPTLKIFFDKCKSFGIKYGYIRTNPTFNRIRWFSDWKRYIELKDSRVLSTEDRRMMAKIRGAIERRSANTVIQGSAGDMTKLALIYLREELLKAGILPHYDAPVKIVNVIHDEIVIEAKAELINHWSEIQQQCMIRAGNVICKKVKTVVDATVTSHWTH